MKKIINIIKEEVSLMGEVKKKEPSKTDIILELLKLLQPTIDDTANTLTEEIMTHVLNYYKTNVVPESKEFTYTPKEDYLKPYELYILFKPSGKGSSIGQSDEHSIELKFIAKNSQEFEKYGYAVARLAELKNDLHHIIKHECSHFYLKLKGLVDLLYYTHPEGLLKYYEDEQEMVLHSREIFDRLIKRFPNWKTADNDRLMRIIADEVKNLPSHTNIPYPFKAPLQKKYVKLIMNSYIIPNKTINENENMGKPKLILPVGISGSGKSTWIKSQTDPNTVVVSPDDIRRELTGSVSDQSNMGKVWALAFKRIVDALNAGKNVILDATNVKSRDRKSLKDYLKVHVDKPFDMFAKIFDVDPEVAKQRVRKDIESGVDRSNVPDYAIDRQYRDFIDGVNTLETDGFKIMDEDVVRSTNSDAGYLDLHKKYTNGYRNQKKPQGLWYEINNDWIRWCVTNKPNWVRKYDIILDIDFTNILILDTYEKALEFQEKYGTDEAFIMIKWDEVAKDYKGIEIPNVGEIHRDELSIEIWISSWDVDSGCIWDLSAIKNYKVIDCATPQPEYDEKLYND